MHTLFGGLPMSTAMKDAILCDSTLRASNRAQVGLAALKSLETPGVSNARYRQTQDDTIARIEFAARMAAARDVLGSARRAATARTQTPWEAQTVTHTGGGAGSSFGSDADIGNTTASEPENLWERLSHIGSAAGEGYLGSNIQSQATAYNAWGNNAASRDIMQTVLGNHWAEIERATDIITHYGNGEDIESWIVDQARQDLETNWLYVGGYSAEELEDLLGYAKEGTVRESYALAQALMNESAAEWEAAKAGLGTVGSTLVDASVAGVEMLMDKTTGALSGVGPMGMMLARSFGTGAYEAASNGGDIDEQLYEGTKNAAIEWFTEHIFSGNPIYDKTSGFMSAAAEKELRRILGDEGFEVLIGSMAVKLAKIPADMFEEGLEEIIGDLLDPAVNGAANRIDGGTRDTTLPTWADLRQSFSTGALLSGWGHAVEGASGAVNGRISGAQYNASIPEEMDNFHLLLPNATEEDIQAFLKKDAGRINETEGFTEGVDNDTIDTQGNDSTLYPVPTEDELTRRVAEGRNDPYNRGVIATRIISGEYSMEYKHNKYIQHTKGTKLYEQVTQARGKPQSYLTISEAAAQALIYQYAGTGTGRMVDGDVTHNEFISVGRIIGYYFDSTGQARETNRIQIIYSRKGAHLVPVAPMGEIKP